MSREITIVKKCFSVELWIISTASSTASSVEWPFLNPYCLGLKKFILVRWRSRKYLRTFSKSLSVVGRRVIGLYPAGVVGSFPGLGMKTTFPIFHLLGKVPFLIQAVKSLGKREGCKMCITFRVLLFTLSGPGAFLLGVFFRSLVTSYF